MFESLRITRVVSTPAAMDGLETPADAIVLRTSPDEALVVNAAPDEIVLSDPHAIVVADTGWHGAWLSIGVADRLLVHGAEWEPVPERPTLAQGMVLHLPVKLWLDDDRALVLTPHVVAEDLARRMEQLP